MSRWLAPSLGLAVFAVGGWALYRLRLQVVAGRLHEGLIERLAERERKTAELHDALLQGVQGLMLRFQLISQALPRNRPQRVMMDSALDEADTVLNEIRNRIQDLRAADLQDGDLELALATLIDTTRSGQGAVGVFIDGVARPVDRWAGHDVLRIVEAALENARRHARADCIEIRVRFGARHLNITVADDGVGMDLDLLREVRVGQLGLTTMRERARRLQARIRFESAAETGTQVSLTVPGHVAYGAGGGAKLPWPRFRRLGDG